MMLLDSKRPFYLISFFIILTLLGIIIYQEYQNKILGEAITIFTGAGQVKINVEYAKTTEELKAGLMNRAKFPKNSGMLFIFPDENNRSFWMKNTLIPLDIIFVSSNGRINEIATLKPCPEDVGYCPSYASKNPVQYVIEVNAGFAQKNRIVDGDILEIPKL